MSVLGQLERVGIQTGNDGRLIPKFFGAKKTAKTGSASTAQALALGYGVIGLTTVGSDKGFTLANGKVGQYLLIYLAVDGADAVITPANFLNGSTITLDDAGDCALLYFDGSNWILCGGYGAVVG